MKKRTLKNLALILAVSMVVTCVNFVSAAALPPLPGDPPGNMMYLGTMDTTLDTSMIILATSQSTGWSGHPNQFGKDIGGGAMTLNGVVYTYGIGMNSSNASTGLVANSVYTLNGQYQWFLATVGVDKAGKQGTTSLWFDVYGDYGDGKGFVKIYDGQANHIFKGPNDTAMNIQVDITGVQILKLQSDDDNNANSDHADWANARVIQSNLPQAAMIYVNGAPLNGFSPTVVTYNYPLPARTPVPAVTAEAAEGLAVTVTQAASPNGSAKILIHDPTAVADNTYTVNFSEPLPTASAIYLDGAPLAGFSPSVTTYECKLPAGASAPHITAAADPGFTVTCADSPSASDSGTVTVYDPVSGLTNVYTLNFSVITYPPLLSGITVNGAALPGFVSSTTVYNYAVVEGDPTPTVAAALADPAHTAMTITQAAGVPGDAVITVTSTDGISAPQTYTIHFTIASATLSTVTASASTTRLNPTLDPGCTAQITPLGFNATGNQISLAGAAVTYSAKTVASSSDNSKFVNGSTTYTMNNLTVVNVSPDGVVTPVNGGSADVTATVTLGGVTQSGTVRIFVTPFYLNYGQTLTMKLDMCMAPANVYTQGSWVPGTYGTFYNTVDDALTIVQKFDSITRGIPKIFYLVGWQYYGHDSGYPAFFGVNAKIAKKDGSMNARDSLIWLMNEAKKYNTTVSLHINMMDAHYMNSQMPAGSFMPTDNTLFNTYVDLGIIGRLQDGVTLASYTYGNPISYQAEWATPSPTPGKNYSQWRIDNLLALLPPLKEGHTIHIDAFHQQMTTNATTPGSIISPWQAVKDGFDPTTAAGQLAYTNQEIIAQKNIINYWHQQGLDMTSEYVSNYRKDSLVGLQPFAWHLSSTPNRTQIPSILYAGGDSEASGSIICGVTMTGETYTSAAGGKNYATMQDEFCLKTLPWYFLNRNDIISYTASQANFTNGIVVTANGTAAYNTTIINQNGRLIKDQGDIFCPALWNNKEIIAYSANGFSNRAWTMPPDWAGVSNVDIYTVKNDGTGYTPLSMGAAVNGGQLTLTLTAGQEVSIVPAGASMDINRALAPGAFTLTSPDNGSTVADKDSVALAWTYSSNALNYRVQVATAPTFDAGAVVYDKTAAVLGETGLTLPAGTLNDGVTYYWRVYANTDTASALNDNGAFSFTTPGGAAVKEAAPNIAIDYAKALLTGFASGSGYAIDAAPVSPDADGALDAAPYMGKTISIVTVSRGAGYTDSDPQSLAVPARPAAPAGLAAAIDGTLTAAVSGVDSTMEYSADNGTTWKPCAGSSIPGLAPGSYQVRRAATGSSFAGAAATIAINIATVKFDSAGGTACPNQYVLYGTAATQPANPTKTGYTFAGWNNGAAPYVWSAPVTSDLTLTAQWTPVTHTITLVYNDGVTPNATLTVNDGAAATQPANPTRAGYTFAGWNNGGTPYIWSTPVTSNLTLTAQWTAITHTITLVYNDGVTPNATLTVNDGAAAAQPANPTRTGYTFAGWNNGGVPYVWSTPVTSNLTLTAQWTPIGEYVPPTSITMSAAQTSLNMKVGAKLSLQITVSPANADPSVTWSSSNPAVATVDPVTGQVTALKTGSVRITVKSNANPAVSYMFLVMINA